MFNNITKATITVALFAFVFNIINPIGIFAAGPASVNLGSASDFVILSKTGVSTTGTTSVIGNIGLSPAAATYITGFALTLPTGGSFSTSALVTGKIYAPGYADPTPVNINTSVSDMETAYTDAMGRTNPTATELGAGNIGGLTLAPGLYKWSSGLTIPTNVTLSGSANDVWIFQIAQNLDISSAKSVVLAGGAKANNVFWIVAGQTTIGTGATFNGNILDQTAIVLNTGAVLNGRALAQTAVTLDANVVTLPSSSNSNSNSNTDSNTNTNINSNSNADSASNIDSANSAPNNIESGCSNNNVYNTSTGAICANNAVPQGCSGGNIYNISTGALCVNNSSSLLNKYNLGITNLGLWSRGDAVMELQRFLNTKLNLNLVVDGKLGPKTIEVIKTWQKANGLVSDGIVGTKTKIKMNTTN